MEKKEFVPKKKFKFPKTPSDIKRKAVYFSLEGDYILIGERGNAIYFFKWDGYSDSFNGYDSFANEDYML